MHTRIAEIVSVRPVIGLEVHVELATRSKMFSRSANPSHTTDTEPEPNTLTDPTVLGLPGALPVMNLEAVEMSAAVGLALGCTIARFSKWDRKNYFYADMPKAYQISQYDLPLCAGGSVEIRGRSGAVRVGIIRAHLEEDAGKLLHEAPGGHAIDHSIVDLNRAGTPLLEIVTAPDFEHAEDVVAFCRWLRRVCVFLGVTRGVMQRGHIRFEPNINTELTLSDGSRVKTPITEVKNLNSFKSVKGAIDHEVGRQPERWLADGVVMGPGTKTTRGWDDDRERTVLQRDKEDAHEYRYFPDPDLPPVAIGEEWLGRIRGRVGELPHVKEQRFVSEYGLSEKEAATLTEEPETCRWYEACVAATGVVGEGASSGGRAAANLLLQNGLKRANERGVRVEALGITPQAIGGIARLRESGAISAASVDELFGLLCDPSHTGREPEALARERGLLIVRDDEALRRWIDEAVATHPKAAEDVRAGKVQAAGRLVGEVMKKAGAAADAKTVREAVLALLLPSA